MPIYLYGNFVSAPTRAVLTTIKHLGLDVNLKETDPFAGDTKTPEFLALNPGHSIPVLVDGDLVLFEGRAIMQYLVNKYAPESPLYPAEPESRAQVDKMLFVDGTSYYPSVYKGLGYLISQKCDPPQAMIEEIADKLQILDEILGDDLQYFAGGDQPSLADISIGITVPILTRMTPGLLSDKMKDWYERVCEKVPQLKECNDKVDYGMFYEKN